MKLEFTARIAVKTGGKVTAKQVEAMKKYLKKLMLDDPDWEHSPIDDLEKVTIMEVVNHDAMNPLVI